MSQQINLYNKKLLGQKQAFSLPAMLRTLGLLVLGMALFYGYVLRQAQLLARQQTESEKRFAAVQERYTKLSAEYSPQQTQKQLEDESRRIEAQLAKLKKQFASLSSMGNTLGYSEYMRAFARQDTGGVWLTGFNISGENNQMTLSGGSLSPEMVPVYIKRLNMEHSMRGKQFAALQMTQHKYAESKPGRPYLEFSLQSFEAGELKK